MPNFSKMCFDVEKISCGTMSRAKLSLYWPVTHYQRLLSDILSMVGKRLPVQNLLTVPILLSFSLLGGNSGGGAVVSAPRASSCGKTPFCLLLALGGRSGGKSTPSVSSVGGCTSGVKVSSRSMMVLRSGPKSSSASSSSAVQVSEGGCNFRRKHL